MAWTDEELDKLHRRCELCHLVYFNRDVNDVTDYTISDDIIDLISELRLARKSATAWKQAVKLYRKTIVELFGRGYLNYFNDKKLGLYRKRHKEKGDLK